MQDNIKFTENLYVSFIMLYFFLVRRVHPPTLKEAFKKPEYPNQFKIWICFGPNEKKNLLVQILDSFVLGNRLVRAHDRTELGDGLALVVVHPAVGHLHHNLHHHRRDPCHRLDCEFLAGKAFYKNKIFTHIIFKEIHIQLDLI